MAMTLKELQSQLTGLEQYTPKTQEEIQTSAENIYKPQYELDVQSLRDQLQTQLNAQNRNAVANGMQRSSYNSAQNAAIRGSGLDALAQLKATYATNVAKAAQDLSDTEYERQTAADQYRNNLLLQLYSLGGSSSSGGNTPTQTPDTDTQTELEKQIANLKDAGATDAQLLKALEEESSSTAKSGRERIVGGTYKEVNGQKVLTGGTVKTVQNVTGLEKLNHQLQAQTNSQTLADMLKKK